MQLKLVRLNVLILLVYIVLIF